MRHSWRNVKKMYVLRGEKTVVGESTGQANVTGGRGEKRMRCGVACAFARARWRVPHPPPRGQVVANV